MAWVDELLNRLCEAHYIAILDLTKGYWQILLDPSLKDKTAFATPSGLYQFTHMPFGLHGGPHSFPVADGSPTVAPPGVRCYLLG